MDQNFFNPQDYASLLAKSAVGVGGNAAQTGIGYGANVRSGQEGKMNALQQLALYRIKTAGSHQKQMDEMRKKLQDLGLEGQQAGLTDYLGVALGGVNAIQGADRRAQMDNMYGGY